MLLRASGQHRGVDYDLRAVVDPQVDSGVAHGSALLAFAEAAIGDDANRLAEARAAVEREAGASAMVEAAAVIGNFSMMDRIANGTGIAMDEMVERVTRPLREELGLNHYPSARNTLERL
jgi:hypothetical protein